MMLNTSVQNLPDRILLTTTFYFSLLLYLISTSYYRYYYVILKHNIDSTRYYTYNYNDKISSYQSLATPHIPRIVYFTGNVLYMCYVLGLLAHKPVYGHNLYYTVKHPT